MNNRKTALRNLSIWLAFALACVLLAANAHAQRVALLVGNASYATGRLTNPPNDVQVMADALREVGFRVQIVRDANQNAMKRAVRDFGTAAKGAEIALLYYSGHATQALGENYLIPIGATIEKEGDYDVEAVSANSVLKQIVDARPKAAIVVLDACRDNPLAAVTKSGTKGLGRMDAPTGSMIAFATAPNTTASDEGFYAKTLAKHIRTRGLELVQVFRETALEVQRVSGGRQSPRVSEMSINEAVYLAGSSPLTPTPAPVPLPAPVPAPSPQVAALTTPPAATASTREVLIGHVAPLTGTIAHLGRDNQNGAQMAIDDLNAAGVVIGGSRIRFRLVTEDDRAEPRAGVEAAQRLCNARVAAVVGHLNSGTSIPASKIYNDCGVPHVSPSATNPKLTEQGYNTTNRIIANDRSLGELTARYAARSLGVRRVVLVDDRTVYGTWMADAFHAAASSLGITIVDRQFTTDTATDFTAVLAAIKAKNPDAIFFGGMDTVAGPMLRQMDAMGMAGIKLLGGDGICSGELPRLAMNARALESAYCSEAILLLDKMPGGAAWKARYEARYPGQSNLYSPYTYDATFVIVEAMKLADSVDPRVFGPRIRDVKFRGVTSQIAFDSKGDLTNPQATFYNFRGNRRTPVQ